MRCSWASAVLIAAGLLRWCAWGAEVRRQGGYWVAEQQGSASAQGVRKLHVNSRGSVTVLGDTADAIRWTVTARALTGDRSRAQTLLEAAVAKQRRVAQDLWLKLTGIEGQPDADIALVVPRELRFCDIRTSGGSVQAIGLNGGLGIVSDAGSLQIDRIHGPVLARTGGGNIRIGQVDGDVRCFTGAGVIRAGWIGGMARLDTAGGEIFVEHAGGPLFAGSAGGNIEVAHADSSISALTKGGVIKVGQAVGTVTADTAGGAIQITGSSGAQCQASEGVIRLKNVAGAVRAISGSGDIVAELMAGRRLENSKLSTNSGDITVVIPASSALTVVAQSTRNGVPGRIISEFPEIRMEGNGGPGGSLEMAEGSLNGGGPLLQVVASGGSIYLKRQRQ